jgi:hypothetical protein
MDDHALGQFPHDLQPRRRARRSACLATSDGSKLGSFWWHPLPSKFLRRPPVTWSVDSARSGPAPPVSAAPASHPTPGRPPPRYLAGPTGPQLPPTDAVRWRLRHGIELRRGGEAMAERVAVGRQLPGRGFRSSAIPGLARLAAICRSVAMRCSRVLDFLWSVTTGRPIGGGVGREPQPPQKHVWRPQAFRADQKRCD